MDKLRLEVIQEMARNGRVYSKEEVKQAAAEILELRRPEQVIQSFRKVIIISNSEADFFKDQAAKVGINLQIPVFAIGDMRFQDDIPIYDVEQL